MQQRVGRVELALLVAAVVDVRRRAEHPPGLGVVRGELGLPVPQPRPLGVGEEAVVGVQERVRVG
ncbi:MAG: hypothetical protein ACPF9W_13055, partial [Nocardioides sp.]